MQMDVELESMFEKMLPTKRETRRTTVKDARRLLVKDGLKIPNE